MKLCKRCGAANHDNQYRKRDSVCNSCRAKDRAEQRKQPGERERERELRKKWYEHGGREIVRKNTKDFRTRTGYPGWSNVLAYQARNKAQRAIRSGRLTRKPCEVCQNPNSHAHHDDYTQPLAIRWLCDPCHKHWHRHNEPIREAAKEK